MLAAHCPFSFEESTRVPTRGGGARRAQTAGAPQSTSGQAGFVCTLQAVYISNRNCRPYNRPQLINPLRSFHLPLSSSSSSSSIPHPLGWDPGLLSESCMAKPPGALVPASGCAVGRRLGASRETSPRPWHPIAASDQRHLRQPTVALPLLFYPLLSPSPGRCFPVQCDIRAKASPCHSLPCTLSLARFRYLFSTVTPFPLSCTAASIARQRGGGGKKSMAGETSVCEQHHTRAKTLKEIDSLRGKEIVCDSQPPDTTHQGQAPL